MNDEELKNKCKERAKIFQQAMESCKSSNPIDCIEWFADRIEELEEENNCLKAKNEELKSEKGCETCTKFDEVKLAKAKKLLKEAQGYIENEDDELYDEIELFLREIEK